jgi:hypothetical protein
MTIDFLEETSVKVLFSEFCHPFRRMTESGPPADAPTKKATQFPEPLFCKIVVGLVPAATAISAITTVSATTIATVSTATTTATVSAAATATTAAFALFHRTRFVHGQGATIDLLAMEFRDGRLRFFGSAHLHEAKAAGTSRHAIIDHLNPRDVARLGKEIGQVVFRHAEGQIAHIEFYAHYFPWMACWLADVSGIGSTLPLS